MRTLFASFIITLFLMSCNSSSEIKIINVNDFGIQPNTKESITSKINKIIEGLDNEPVTIVFPKGRYDFYPDSTYFKPYFETNTYDINPKRLAIFIQNKKNITIDANHSDFVYHGHIQPFTIDNSENIEIKNLTIDWDQPLTAEAKVLEADSEHLLVEIDTVQFPHKVLKDKVVFSADDWKANWRLSGGSWLIEYDKNHIIPAFTGDHGTVNGKLKEVVYSKVGTNKLLMKGEFTKTPAVGNYLIMRHSDRDHAGIFLFHSKNLKLENIDVYHTSGLGILSQYCENITMKKVNMIPNPKKNRYLSGHDDGLHFMGCKGDIIVDNCDAQGLMDDAINIHGTYVPVLERVNDTVLKCSYAHDMSLGLIWAKENDKVSFVNKKNMISLGTSVVKSFTQIDEKTFTVEFKNKIPEELSKDFSLENMSWTPTATITNCFIGSNRARGYLISTPKKVVIENNIFETSGSAILIAGDANYWYESGAVTDITIRNNEFKYPCNSSAYQFCKAIISIYPEIPEADANQPYHNNITIENNSFNPSDYPILFAKSVDGLQFNNNKITRSYAYTPWHSQKQNFFLDACKNVEISGNTVDKNLLGKNIILKNMSSKELDLKNKEFSLELFKEVKNNLK
ncbi:alpha-1,3-galactosidase B [Polaribacter haliotis]|uniref:Alpha-1,3-galactosidase B n=1 Tax=Polaribacter haliotis TaxID=1888915 RepID=A0A7L8AIG3_9FLAO|nr:alpha-1,3-galactosidase B [Polaribacter haliotis]QOD61757.1 alpha-1,3-galactosidase B [Polaribacter haliotis]